LGQVHAQWPGSLLAPGGGRELVSLGGTSNVKNQSLSVGFDYTLNPTTVWDMRFGWFKYDVAVPANRVWYYSSDSCRDSRIEP